MSSPSSQLLVICPEEDHPNIARILADGGYAGSAHADGGAGTVERFLELDPDVVVVYASLHVGDARALTSELRQQGRVAKLILIGDTDGPVRNALDAADFAVDRFLARPLASKALLFAVRTCLDAAQRARQKAAAAPSSQLERKMASAMDQAIDEFVRTAMDALPAQTQRPPVPFSPATSTPEISPAPYPPSSTGPIPMITPRLLASSRAAERRAKRARTPKRLSSTMVAVPPPPTGEGEAQDDESEKPQPPTTAASETASAGDERAPGRTPPSGDERAASGDSGEQASGAEPGDRPPPRSGSGAFARQLRRKMSDMAARLFPSKEGTPSVDLGIARTHSSEIDLSSFGVDTVVEVPKDTGALDQLRSTSSAANKSASQEGDTSGEVASLDFGVTVESRVEPSHIEGSDEGTDSGESAAEERPQPERRPRAATENDSKASAGIPAPEKGGSAKGGSAKGGSAQAVSIDAFGQRGHTVVNAASDDMELQGSIRRGEADAALLIERMYRQRFDGRVRFENYNAAKEIFFDKGRPVFATSNQAHDRMGEQLFREGKITSVQLAKVRDIVAKTGRRMGEILIEKGWLKRRELLPVVRRHIEDLVYSLFAWEEGEYEIIEGDFAASERIRISRHPAAMILEGVRRKYELDSLQALLGAPDSVVEIVDDRNLKSVMSVADLNSAERKVMTGFDGERSLTDVHEMSSIELTEVYQLAYGLVVWGAAQSMRRGEDGPIVASDEPALFGETDLAIDRQRVSAKYSLVMEADYFALLGVRRDATSFEVKRAYEAARRDFTGDGFPSEIRSELGGHIDEINEVLEEAYLILRDDALRASYLANLRG